MLGSLLALENMLRDIAEHRTIVVEGGAHRRGAADDAEERGDLIGNESWQEMSADVRACVHLRGDRCAGHVQPRHLLAEGRVAGGLL